MEINLERLSILNYASSVIYLRVSCKQVKTLITILILSISHLCSGQDNTKDFSYKSFPELTLPTNANVYSFPKSFTSAGSGSGWTLNLTQDNGFTFIENVDCTEAIVLAKGSWTIKGSKLILSAKDFKRTYDIIVFHNYAFLIEQSEKQNFLREFQSLKQKFNSEQNNIRNERIYLNLQDNFLNRRGAIASS